MTTKTAQWAARPQSTGDRRCYALSPATSFLIANLELEFELSYRKLSPPRISNRKYFAILNRTWLPHPTHACHSSQFAPNCNSNRDTAIRISPNPYHYSEFEISNRDKMTVLRIGFFRLGFHKPYSEFLPQIDH